jgi:hypothetical protein
MRWRWLFGNFAEPQHDLTPQRQRDLSWRAHEKHMPRGRFLAVTLLGIVLPTIVLYAVALPAALAALGLSGRRLPYMVGCTAICVIVWPLSALVYGHAYVRAVRRAMRDLGHEVCIGCGYRLDGLPIAVARCPECGRDRAPPPPPPPDAGT